MTVVSSKEFVTNQEKYFDMALNDRIVIQRGTNMFVVQNFVTINEPDVVFEPDSDFFRSIPIEEVRDRVVGYVRKKHSK